MSVSMTGSPTPRIAASSIVGVRSGVLHSAGSSIQRTDPYSEMAASIASRSELVRSLADSSVDASGLLPAEWINPVLDQILGERWWSFTEAVIHGDELH